MSFESKVISSLLFGVVSYFVTSYLDKQHARREVQLDLITRQVGEIMRTVFFQPKCQSVRPIRLYNRHVLFGLLEETICIIGRLVVNCFI